MRSEHYQRIAKMMQGFDQDTPDSPTVADEKTRILRVRLIMEEALEFAAASGVFVQIDGETLDFDELEFVGTATPNLVEMADGLADLSVVTIGSLVAFGIADEPLLKEVDENNLLKIATGHKDPATGKFIKAPDHPLPNIAGVLDFQRSAALSA